MTAAIMVGMEKWSKGGSLSEAMSVGAKAGIPFSITFPAASISKLGTWLHTPSNISVGDFLNNLSAAPPIKFPMAVRSPDAKASSSLSLALFTISPTLPNPPANLSLSFSLSWVSFNFVPAANLSL